MLTSDAAALRAFLAHVVNRAATRLGLSHVALTPSLEAVLAAAELARYAAADREDAAADREDAP